MLNLYPHDLIDSGIFISAKLNFHIIQVWTQKCAVQKASVDVNISYY
jgi:hypothetical protein